jgi:hypothetical protein
MIQLRVNKDHNSYSYNLDYSEYWEAETEKELIIEYADHLFEHDRSSIDQIVDVYKVTSNKSIRPYSTGEKWELSDKINERLETLHNEYLDYRREQDDLYEDYKQAVLPY